MVEIDSKGRVKAAFPREPMEDPVAGRDHQVRPDAQQVDHAPYHRCLREVFYQDYFHFPPLSHALQVWRGLEKSEKE